MEINKLTRKVRLDSLHTAIKYQLITELVFLRRQSIIDSDLTYLALLVEWGPISLKEFCHKAVVYLFGKDSALDGVKHPVRVQTVRNRLGILEKRGFILKEGRGKKTLAINPAIPIKSNGNLLLEYNFIYLETKETKESNTPVIERAAAL